MGSQASQEKPVGRKVRKSEGWESQKVNKVRQVVLYRGKMAFRKVRKVRKARPAREVRRVSEARKVRKVMKHWGHSEESEDLER